MDLTYRHFIQYILVAGAYSDIDALREGGGAWDGRGVEQAIEADLRRQRSWQSSLLNPTTRIDSLVPHETSAWRVDGASSCGRRIYALPVAQGTNPGFPPLRVDVWLPSLSGLPKALANQLDCLSAVHIRDGRFGKLGLAKYVIRALGLWASRNPGFNEFYRSLPFGSKICFEAVEPAVSRARLVCLASAPPLGALGVDQLAAAFGTGVESLAPRIALRALEIVRQLNERVSIVRVAGSCGAAGGQSDELIFKSSASNTAAIYHEIQELIRSQGVSYVCECPMYLVTDHWEGDSEVQNELVIGFIVKFYDGGSLNSNLIGQRQDASPWAQKLEWARQLTTFLQEITSTGNFYSDLKTDNVVLSSKELHNRHVVVVDFEQTGAGVEWTPPEIIALERLQGIVRYAKSRQDRSWAAEMLQLAMGQSWTDLIGQCKQMVGRSRALWQSLDANEREAAMVFMLGKVLYCIFEGVPTPTAALEESMPNEPYLQFPDFEATPQPLRELVAWCTAGAREHDQLKPRVVRSGNKLYAYADQNLAHAAGGRETHSVRATVEALQTFWLDELVCVQRFILARARYQEGETAGVTELSYLQRPKLGEVLHILETATLSL